MFYPLFLNLQSRPILVVGGGPIAERKVESLLEAGADVTVVAPDVTPGLRKLGVAKSIRLVERKFEGTDLEGSLLVITATDDPGSQQQVAAAARARRIPVNTVDQPALCDFIVPAIMRRGDILLAISTLGRSPTLAAVLRKKLETVITDDTARAVRLLGEVRSEVHTRFQDPARRKEVFERIVDSGILDWIRDCDDAAARKRIREIIGGLG